MRAWYEGKITAAVNLAKSNEIFGRARSIYDAECRRGDAWNCKHLAEAYEKGKGVPIDLSKARELHSRACDLGSKESCERHGVLSGTVQ